MTNSRLNSGDWIGSQLKGPHWTPYAQAIADCYPIQVPWYYTLPSNLTEGVTFQRRRTETTSPQQHDVLIFGAYAIVRGAGGDEGNFILLQVTHEETGIPWAVPNVIGAAVLPAIAGTVNVSTTPNPTTILKLPEAFFLPRHNRLKLDWAQSVLDFGTNLDARITFVGVQLIGGGPPEEISMPDGSVIPLGARLPWFVTLVMGDSSRFQQWLDWNLANNAEDLQFSPPQDCDIEIHDAYFSRPGGTTGVITKLTQMGSANSTWTPVKAPIDAWAGNERQVNPALPFTKPFLLKTGQRIALLEQNNIGFTLLWRMVTFRGVRLCRF